jgi:hypothetical protein
MRGADFGHRLVCKIPGGIVMQAVPVAFEGETIIRLRCHPWLVRFLPVEF